MKEYKKMKVASLDFSTKENIEVEGVIKKINEVMGGYNFHIHDIDAEDQFLDRIVCKYSMGLFKKSPFGEFEDLNNIIGLRVRVKGYCVAKRILVDSVELENMEDAKGSLTLYENGLEGALSKVEDKKGALSLE